MRGLALTLLQPFLPVHTRDQGELIKQGQQPLGGSFLDKTWVLDQGIETFLSGFDTILIVFLH